MYPVPLESLPEKRRKVALFIESDIVVRTIIGLIVLNAIILGFETDKAMVEQYGEWLSLADTALLCVFTIELAVKFYAYRLNFFRSGWNIFDFLIVGIAWVPASGPFAVLRAFRILRILRLLSMVPQMRRVISALAYSIPGMSSVLGVLVLVFYVCAVLSTKLFGQHPDPLMQEWFGTIGASAYTLFQIMTLESWSMGIVRPTMELYSWSWMFFVPFIVITSFAVLNLFIGIIVDAMQLTKVEDLDEEKEEIQKFTHQEMEVLSQQMSEMMEHVKGLQQTIDRLENKNYKE
ncbi:MAG: ion transporter [Cellvibrionaceae bacterium]